MRDVTPHLGLVYAEARRLSRCVTVMEEGDLVGFGTLGLLRAAEGFQPDRGWTFATYALPRIRGAMLDAVRDEDVLSRRDRRRLRLVAEAHASIASSLNRSPTLHEIAGRANLPLRTVDQLRVVCLRPVLLDHPTEDDPFLASEDDPSAAIAHRMEVRALANAMQRLTTRQRETLRLHYVEGWTFRAIAQRDGVTEGAVSLRHSAALARLRKILVPAGLPGEDVDAA